MFFFSFFYKMTQLFTNNLNHYNFEGRKVCESGISIKINTDYSKLCDAIYIYLYIYISIECDYSYRVHYVSSSAINRDTLALLSEWLKSRCSSQSSGAEVGRGGSKGQRLPGFSHWTPPPEWLVKTQREQCGPLSPDPVPDLRQTIKENEARMREEERRTSGFSSAPRAGLCAAPASRRHRLTERLHHRRKLVQTIKISSF